MNGKLACSAAVIGLFAAFAGCASSSATGGSAMLTTGSGDSGGAGTGGSGAGSMGTGASTGAARQYFLSTVYPDLATLANSTANPATCGSCHAPPGMDDAPIYMGADAASSYNVITNTPGFIAAPKNSLLVINGSIAHTGPGMNAQQKADVLHWLSLEVQERGLSGSGMSGSGGMGQGGGGGGSITLSDALVAYGQCMDYTLWQNPPTGVGLDHLPSQQTAAGDCQGCHLAGLSGNWLSSNSQETFAKNQILPYVTRQVTGELDENGAFKKLVPSNRWRDKGSETCNPDGGHECHPQFTLSSPILDGIDSFVSATIQKFENGDCMGTGGGGGTGGSGGSGGGT